MNLRNIVSPRRVLIALAAIMAFLVTLFAALAVSTSPAL
jgi:hypothetical protein